jgi:hypothetical protein
MDRPGSGFKRLIVLLSLLNLGVLLAGWGGALLRGGDPGVVSFNAAKIQLLADVVPERDAAPSRPKGDALSAPTPEPEADARSVGGAACLSWPALEADSLAQVRAYLRSAGVADADYELQTAMRLGWWAYIPPLKDAAALQVVMDDARAKGVLDMAPVRAGQMIHALALGSFPSMALAERHAAEMTRRGLRDVRFAPRPGAGPVRIVVIKEGPALRAAFAAAWPPGLAPGTCPAATE